MYAPPPQAPYPPQGYPATPNSSSAYRAVQPAYAHFSQPPSQVPPTLPYYPDPATFRKDYTDRLRTLTINSRPIIQDLSMIAQEYTRWSNIVGQCLESHIRQVPPWMKLPAFYVLDAIAKNVFQPYARTFATFIVPLFLEVYGHVDIKTRQKMDEMLITWRTGAPDGRALFDARIQADIERGIWGGSQHHAESSNTGHAFVSQSQVLSELDFVLSAKQRFLQTSPLDHTVRGQTETLYQLRSLVEAGVSQMELQQILTQLRTMAASASAPAPPTRAVPSVAAGASFPSTSVTSMSGPSVMQHSSVPALPPTSIGLPVTLASTPPGIAPTTSAGLNIQGLFSSLVKAGIVSHSNSSTPVPIIGAHLPPVSTSDPIPSADRDVARIRSRDYRRRVLAHKIKLTSLDISRVRPVYRDLQHERLPAQCKQCGIRFPADGPGKTTMNEHLDMHFRQNRKATQSIGRGHSRAWFISIDDWISDMSANTKGKAPADSERRLTVKEAAAANARQRDTELRAMHVVVPPGEEGKQLKCPICKEPMNPELLDDEEEWAWKNAVQKDDKVYHATCHAEALFSAATLATRLLQEGTISGSRGSTPDKRLTPPKSIASKASPNSPGSPEKIAGQKRKAEDEEHGTPPKKFALSL